MPAGMQRSSRTAQASTKLRVNAIPNAGVVAFGTGHCQRKSGSTGRTKWQRRTFGARPRESAGDFFLYNYSQRYEHRRSILVTSNRVVQDWGKYFGDATMATTILDRLMHRAAMLEFEQKSYQLKEAAARIAFTPKQAS